MLSTLPDKFLRIGMRLPFPADRISFAILKRLFFAICRLAPLVIVIQFGALTIKAPLNHPAVYWRYRPVTANRNYVLVVQSVTEKKQGIVIDVGANIGDGVALLRSHGIDAPIYAVEGTDEWYKFLAANTSKLKSIILEKAYLGAAAQTGGLTIDQSRGTGILIEGTSDFEIRTLDSLLGAKAISEVAVLKTDTDGFDAKVLYGSENLLRKQRPVVFSEIMETLLNQNGDASATLLNFLSELGYAHMMIWDHDGGWLETREVSTGIADLLPSYPGEPGKSYLDIAFFSEEDLPIIESIERSYGRKEPAPSRLDGTS